MKSKTCSLRPLLASFVVVFGMWKTAVRATDNRTTTTTTTVVKVGVVLDLSTSIGKTVLSCIDMSLSDFNASRPHRTTTILLHIKDSKGDAIQAAAQGLELIDKSKVEAILGPESWMQQLGEKAEVPIISFNDPTIFTPIKSPYFFRLAHNHSSQIYAIRDIIKAFTWTRVAVIYQGDDFRNSVVLDLIEALQGQEVDTRVHRIDPTASNEQIRQQLANMSSTVFVVHMVHKQLTSTVFAIANEIGMMSEGYAWILTDTTTYHVLNSKNVSTLNSMQGVLGVKTYVPRTKSLENFTARWKRKFRHDNPDEDDTELDVRGLWAYDAAWAVATAVETMGSKDPNFNISGVSRIGNMIMKSISTMKFGGLSGEFSLVKGNLDSPNLEIVNVIGDGESRVGYWRPKIGITGEFNKRSNLKPIIWPGYSIKVPDGWNANRTLRIGVPLNQFMPLDLTNGSISGYVTDIFEAAVAELPYSVQYEFILFLGPSYDDLILEVYNRVFDAAVGDITILANRTSFVDFTLPFTEPGISVIVPARDGSVNHAWVFLKPLTLNLWITSFCFFVFVGFVVCILEHQNNEDFRQGSLSHRIGTSLWFSFSIMVFAQRETLKNNLTRFVVVIWFFVVFVLTQSYTASLTSWLTVQQLQPVTDINQIIKSQLHVGYQKGSYAYDTMKFLGIKNLVPYSSIEELHELFEKGSCCGGIDAAIDEIPYMKLLLAKYLNSYTMADSQYYSGGFGFAFSRGSPLVIEMSKAVSRVIQSETMKEIEEKWFGKKMSDESGGGGGIGSGGSSEVSSSSLDLTYFSSLFLITASAAILALALYFLNFIRNQGFVDNHPCFWRTVAATLPIFITKDHRREGQVDAEPPLVSAEASPTTNAPQTPSSDSIHSPDQDFTTHSSHHNQASLEIIHG